MQQTSTSSGDTERLLNQVMPLVRAIVKRKLKSWPSRYRDDIHQAVLIGLWQRLPKFNPQRGSLEAFIAVAVENLVVDELRKLESDQPGFILLPEELAAETEKPTNHNDDGARLALLIRNCPSDYLPPSLTKIYLALRAYSTAAEAARSLKLSIKTFTERKHHLKTRLQKIFEEHRSRKSELPRIAI